MRSYRTAALLVVIHVLASGCQPHNALGRSGVALAPPGSWRAVSATTWMTAGLPLAAWSGPGGSSLVVYRALPMPGGSPTAIAEALANRLENLPGLTVRAKRTERIAETVAARVEVTASGTGDALAPSGTGTPVSPAGKTLMPTRQVNLGFVRPDATIYIVWHAPESAFHQIEPDIDATLATLRFTSSGNTSSYSN